MLLDAIISAMALVMFVAVSATAASPRCVIVRDVAKAQDIKLEAHGSNAVRLPIESCSSTVSRALQLLSLSRVMQLLCLPSPAAPLSPESCCDKRTCICVHVCNIQPLTSLHSVVEWPSGRVVRTRGACTECQQCCTKTPQHHLLNAIFVNNRYACAHVCRKIDSHPFVALYWSI
jgi:hypothetical protein